MLMSRNLLLILSMSSAVLAAPVKHTAETDAGVFEPKITQPGNMLAGLKDIQENLKNSKESGEKGTKISKPIKSSLSLNFSVLLENGSTTHYPKATHTNPIENDTHSQLLNKESGKLEQSQQFVVTKSVTTMKSPGIQKTTTNTTLPMEQTTNILRDITGNQSTSMIPITALPGYTDIITKHTETATADNSITDTIPKMTTSPIKRRNLMAISSTTESGTNANDESSPKPSTHFWTSFTDAKSHPLVNINRRSHKLFPDVDLLTSTTFRPPRGNRPGTMKKPERHKTFQTSSGAKTPLRTKREAKKQNEKLCIKSLTGNPPFSVTKQNKQSLLPWEMDTNATIKVSKRTVPQEYDYDVEADRDGEWHEASQKEEENTNDCHYCSERTESMGASANFIDRTTIFQTEAPQLQTTISHPRNPVSSQMTTTEITKNSFAKGYNLGDTDGESGAEKHVNQISEDSKRCCHKDKLGEKPAMNTWEQRDPDKSKPVNLQKCQHKCSVCEAAEFQKVEITKKRVFYRKFLRSFAG